MGQTHQFFLGAVLAVGGLSSTFAHTANHTLVYEGKAKMHSIKLGPGSGLPSFPGVSKMAFKFTSATALPAGTCTKEEFPQSATWSLVFFTDGSNTYTPSTGLIMKTGQVLPNVTWMFTACLDANSNLTQFSGIIDASTQPIADTEVGFASAFSTEGPAAVDLQIAPGQYQQYLGRYGLSIGWDGTYSQDYLWVEMPTAFDAYDGSRKPKYSYK